MKTKMSISAIKATRARFSAVMRTASLFAALSLPLAATAEPIKLKFSFFTSDRSYIYQNSIKPFVDAINKEGKGLVEIDMYFSGTISSVQADQPQLVADGTADLALIVPGRTPATFRDTVVMELPGLYRDQREASLVFTRLTDAGALKGYENFYVLGAFVADTESIHTRKPVTSLDDLKGLSIRVNNQTQAAVLERLGAMPALLAINQTTEAISTGKIDGATFPPSMLFEFGVGRVTNNHYMIGLGGAPTAMVMNRKTFDRLPEQARKIIREFSGRWTAEKYIKTYQTENNAAIESLNRDSNRKVVVPSPADLAHAQAVFKSEVAAWAAADPRHQRLLEQAEAELSKIRTGTVGQQ